MEQIIFPFNCFGVFIEGHTGKPETYDESVSPFLKSPILPAVMLKYNYRGIFILMLLKTLCQ
jgi:hypothetical protein